MIPIHDFKDGKYDFFLLTCRIIMFDPHDDERTTNKWNGLELIK